MYSESASPYGLYDCAGNVWEWCLNKYGQPENVEVGGRNTRVLRGGSWFSYHGYARCAFRNGGLPGNRDYYRGFRCCVVSPSSP